VNELIQKIQVGLCRFIGEILLEAGLVSACDIDAAISEQKRTGEYLGQILVRQGLINQEQLVEILELQLATRLQNCQETKQSLGEILLENQSITRWQLARTLELQGLSRKKIGQLLIELGFTSRGTVEQALSHQAVGAVPRTCSQKRKSLGELLLQVHRITPEALQVALQEQAQTQDYLGHILVRQGFLTEDELEDLLATQMVMTAAEEQMHSPFPEQGSQTSKKASLFQPIRRKLGEILIATRQLSPAQLAQAVTLQKHTPKRLGDLLVELGLVPMKEIQRALRLQKRLLTLLMGTALGVAVLASCSRPIVPGQIPAMADMSIASQFGAASTYQSGAFKTLEVGSGQSLRVFQNGSKILERVPFFKQGNDNTCGQAVMTSLLNYWGDETSYQAVVDEANPRNLPTTDMAMITYLRSKGLKAQAYRRATIDNLISQINKGRPTPVLLDFGGISQEHYVIVVGYNLKKNTLVIHDSLNLEGPYMEMDIRVFERMWQNRSLRNIHVFGGDNYYRIMFDVYR
jgi:predicted double-glycine peptidase